MNIDKLLPIADKIQEILSDGKITISDIPKLVSLCVSVISIINDYKNSKNEEKNAD